jgi:putative hydrolase of the HAD superfamily
MSAIEALLFDFGGVITSSPFELMAKAGEEAGLDPAAVLDLLMGDYATDSDHPWHQLERGEIPVSEYGQYLVKAAQEAGMPIDFSALRGLFGKMAVHDNVVDAIRRLRKDGYRTALITNTIREAGEAWRALVPLAELFEVVVDSSEVGMRKPNPAIYHHALELLGNVPPERAVMLDDAPGNVAAAIAAGLHGILVADPAVALTELDALLASA